MRAHSGEQRRILNTSQIREGAGVLVWINYVLGQVVSFFFTLLRMVPLAWLNRFSHTWFPETGEVIISLTSPGDRLKQAHYTLESIARGFVKAPVVLWLDQPDFDSKWPRSLCRLVKRGLQVRCSDGRYGPHTKYWGQFRQVAGSSARITTIDDDMIYPEWFLQRLFFIGNLRGEKILPYLKWTAADTSRASFPLLASV